ncbi:replicative helicase loader/inhibitor [Paenibacillus sp. TAF43_2]|uniref:replicative helicase loader/inhibitor n=1 Tax=Paenibacillus sp. TAF43_2 TaxID=3233069 RepID=UPI003F9D2DEC
MKQTETAQLLAVIKTAYQNFLVTDQAVRLWHEYMKEISFSSAQKNLQEHIRSNRFPPTIADIVRHDPNQFTDHQRLELETEERFALMDEWEQKATDIPEHVRNRIEFGQKLLKRGVVE